MRSPNIRFPRAWSDDRRRRLLLSPFSLGEESSCAGGERGRLVVAEGEEGGEGCGETGGRITVDCTIILEDL